MHLSPSARASALLALVAFLPACPLIAIEPDEIDIADADEIGETDGGVDEAGDGDGDTGDDESGTEESGNTEDPDTDTTDDASSSEAGSDSETTDESTTGDTGEESDSSSPTVCDELTAQDVMLGANAIELVGEDSLAGSCGAEGPELLTTFVAEEAGTYEFAVTDIEAVVYVLGDQCTLSDELACAMAEIAVPLAAGETVHPVVDSLAGAGAGTLTITKL